MPGEYPNGWLTRNGRQPADIDSTRRTGNSGAASLAAGVKCKPGAPRGTLRRSRGIVAASALFLSAGTALAQGLSFGALDPAAIASQALDSRAVLLLAVFGGAMSFALLSAFWLIRERARIGGEYGNLRQRFGEVRADRDRLASLVQLDDQRIVVWDGGNELAGTLGNLPERCGAPAPTSDFVAFGKWLEPGSAQRIEEHVRVLRENARQFTTGLTTQSGAELEAQGRVSGGNAFVRFVPIEGAREKIARLESEREQLDARFALLEEMFAASSGPVWISGPDGKLQYVNQAYAVAVDAQDADAAVSENRPLFDAKERELIGQACSETGHFSGNLPAIVAGDRRMMETVVIATPQGNAGIATDRSEIEAVRATLKHAIAGHQLTFDHLAAAVAIFDGDQRLEFHNTSFQQMWDLDARELESRPGSADLLELLRATGKLPDMPEWRKWKQGVLDTLRANETHQDHWHLPDGRTLRVVVNPHQGGGASWVFENLTKEMELKSSYNALMRVQGETLDHLGEAVAVFGSNGRIRLTNPAFAQLWGFEDQAALAGCHIAKISDQVEKRLSNPGDWEEISIGITGMDEDRQDLSGRLELADGSVRDYRLARLPEGQSMLTLADVTASVNVERALKERNDALEESDMLKTRFIQHVSYELRAPLTSIAGFTEILSSRTPGKLNAKQEEYLDYISTSSDVLKALIDDILDLASIDAGAMELDLEQVDLAGVISESLEGIANKSGRAGIEIDVKVPADASSLIADKDRLRQVIYNLVSNAVSASPDGGRVTIETGRDDSMILIRVTDEGPGIPESQRNLIFQRFESGRGSGRKGGAGLGLSIVKSFVELHGGSIDVSNAGKRGAVFTCRFPLKPEISREAAE